MAFYAVKIEVGVERATSPTDAAEQALTRLLADPRCCSEIRTCDDAGNIERVEPSTLAIGPRQ